MRLINPDSPYHRERWYNRKEVDISRLILNYLLRTGPTPITEIVYVMKINHSQAKKSIVHLAESGLVVSKGLQEYDNPLEMKIPNRSNKISTMHPRTKNLVMITPLGRKWLAKMNELELLLKWET